MIASLLANRAKKLHNRETIGNADDQFYYGGQKDLQEKALRVDLADSGGDLDRSVTLHAHLSMLLRGQGQSHWQGSQQELKLANAILSRSSRDSQAFVHAAEGALLLEMGELAQALEKLTLTYQRFSQSSEHLKLRQCVSSLWKAAEIEASLRRSDTAKILLARAQGIAQDIGDLHGYANARIAEAHTAAANGDYKTAIASLIWVSHPPHAIGQDQPHRREKTKWLGFVHPLWALKFAEKRLQVSMSFPMRVPFWGKLAIASLEDVSKAFAAESGMLPKDLNSRARFSPKEQERILSFYGGICALCGERIEKNEKFDIDHIVCHSMGQVPKKTARPAYLNYRPTHAKCNRGRGNDDFWFLVKSHRNNPTVWVETAWPRFERSEL